MLLVKEKTKQGKRKWKKLNSDADTAIKNIQIYLEQFPVHAKRKLNGITQHIGEDVF